MLGDVELELIAMAKDRVCTCRLCLREPNPPFGTTRAPHAREGAKHERINTVTLEVGLKLINGLAVVFASVVAVWGINAWRRELVGRRRYELAEEGLALFYEARDVVRHMRIPFAAAFEQSEDAEEDREDETEDDRWNRVAAEFPFKIYEQRQEVFGRLNAIKYRFMTTFGSEYAQAFNEVNAVTRQVFAAARSLHQLHHRQVRRYQPAREEPIRKMEAIRYVMSEDDELENRLNVALKRIDEVCRKEMKRQGYWARLFAKRSVADDAEA